MAVILSVTPFLTSMSYFLSFPFKCGIAPQTVPNSAVHVTVSLSPICPMVILLSSAKLSAFWLPQKSWGGWMTCLYTLFPWTWTGTNKMFPVSHFLARYSGMQEENCPPRSHLQQCCWAGGDPLQRCMSKLSGRLRWIFGSTSAILIQFYGPRDQTVLGICFVTWYDVIKRCLAWRTGLCCWDFMPQYECFEAVLCREVVGFTLARRDVQIWGPFAVSRGKWLFWVSTSHPAVAT